MICEKRITHFIVQPVEHVSVWLQKGYYLYGEMRYDPAQGGHWVQALVKCLVPEQRRITPTEARCLQWAIVGKTAEETAMLMGNSKSTVNKHLAALRRKFDCTTLRQVIAKASESGLIVNEKVCLPE